MSDYPEWQHRFQAKRPYPAYGPKAYIHVEAGLHYLRGNTLPYFSVTAEIWNRPGARDCVACGCIHGEVLKGWPNLAPVVALHLSDSDGAPMHAEANGWYQLSGYLPNPGGYHAGNSKRNFADGYRNPTPDECLASFAEHVRLPFEVVKATVDGWLQAAPSFGDADYIRRHYYQPWLEAQRPRWKAEAEAACQLLDSLPAPAEVAAR